MLLLIFLLSVTYCMEDHLIERFEMSIRVLQIVTYMGRGGLETMLMNYYRHIDHNKVQFDFLVHREFEADYDEEILSLGGKIYHVSRLIPWSISYREMLKKFFQQHPEYKIVHVHQDCLSSVALQCAKECGVPVRIAHSHNSSQDINFKYFIKRYYMKQIPTYATDLFACSKMAGDWMFGGHKYRILYNAIDLNKYVFSPIISSKVRHELNIGNDMIIGHIGRFDPQKNHNLLIDIFVECLKLNSNVKLLLVGDGNDRKKIQDKVDHLGIHDKVIFTGVRNDVPELLQAMNVFVFPSLYEGLPVTLIEAQAAGLPCVISNRISDECEITNGLIIFKGVNESPDEWAKCILEKMSHPKCDHIKEIQSAGYDIVSAASWLEEFYLKKSGEV